MIIFKNSLEKLIFNRLLSNYNSNIFVFLGIIGSNPLEILSFFLPFMISVSSKSVALDIISLLLTFIFVLDKFHYRKALNYIFKKEPITTEIADGYLRNKMINEFKILVKVQCKLYPEQKEKMIKQQKGFSEKGSLF